MGTKKCRRKQYGTTKGTVIQKQYPIRGCKEEENESSIIRSSAVSITNVNKGKTEIGKGFGVAKRTLSETYKCFDYGEPCNDDSEEYNSSEEEKKKQHQSELDKLFAMSAQFRKECLEREDKKKEKCLQREQKEKEEHLEKEQKE